MTSQGQRTLKLYTGKGYPQELAAPSAVASSRGQALAAGTLLLAMDALRSGGSFAILSHNCPAINRLNVDGWESPSLSIAIFRQEILSFPQVFCQPTWYLT
jgi:hypothetical protein